jgi:hypothetical protein
MNLPATHHGSLEIVLPDDWFLHVDRIAKRPSNTPRLSKDA